MIHGQIKKTKLPCQSWKGQVTFHEFGHRFLSFAQSLDIPRPCSGFSAPSGASSKDTSPRPGNIFPSLADPEPAPVQLLAETSAEPIRPYYVESSSETDRDNSSYRSTDRVKPSRRRKSTSSLWAKGALPPLGHTRMSICEPLSQTGWKHRWSPP
jgi:hypothetical protein